ncbi:MAG: glycosyltransferase family 39 protein [Acidobacteria bacterium]|nr:glycosyltransferase family 39 protein [Acidobacteriota bacterium]
MDDALTKRSGPKTPPGNIVWEDAPYAVCGLAALLLRLPALDRWPLSAAEAVSAWTAWRLAQGDGPVIPLLDQPPASAALFGLQSALFWFVGGGDYVARLAPALAGAAVVAVAWLLRRRLGRTASIALAVLLAGDPLSVGYSRLGDGAVLVSTACWVVFAGLIVLADEPTPRVRAVWIDGVSIAAGFALAAGPLVWDLGPPLVVSVLVLRPRRPIPVGRRHGVLAGATALMVATSGLTQWDGPPLVSASAGGWLHQWTRPLGIPLGELWASLLGYEMLPLMLGIGGLLAARSRRNSPVLAGWLVWACLLTLRPGRTPAAWLVMAPPLMLSAASAVSWLETLIRTAATRLAAVPASVAAGVTALLLAQFVHGSFDISGGRFASGFRPYAVSTASGVRLLAEDVDLVQRRALTATRLPLEVVAPAGVDPVLAWYLRAEPTLRWVAAPSPPSPEGPRLVVEPADEGPEARTGGYGIRRIGAVIERVRLR